ncbi:class I mannose-6-phosphate isomerase [Paenibacillus nasutitermitis]|uniref:Mannose-6-phosphate isomerase n=1 Tax=Paenibacillus nasutitermitis TaxID=1652958 RepID=A0A916Z2A2_9BACL|nr:class I mannose-6-phosphate isomerase [Paenibacillus nasutitermitis]GGD72332.1 mannose-6-phosphate isomerase [Paenibacillus nasutitermitis]
MSNYDKEPRININGWDDHCWENYESIGQELNRFAQNRLKTVIIVECYTTVRIQEIVNGLKRNGGIVKVIKAERAAKSKTEIHDMIERFVTEDRVFGYMAPFQIEDFYHSSRIEQLRAELDAVTEGTVVMIGTGASLIGKGDCTIYADLARWEIQKRYRSHEFGNWLEDNFDEDILRKYKRGFFIEWRAADRLKRSILPTAHYYLDTNLKDAPKMVSREALFDGIKQAVHQPFRLVPYFDPGVWGGTWMERNIGLEKQKNPYAWSFDGVPEENSVYLQFGSIRLEMPSVNLVFFEPKALLGNKVYARFGAEFPIRFDFLDTVGGQPLSLQVHPLAGYIRDKFGMHYTQDESYYMLDVEPGATVYLGTKEGINPQDMLDDLEKAQAGGFSFPAEQYINVFPADKHDHFSIPAGTIHCSGTNGMVLEISATPYIFTFKLWDWDRLGLDGKPRPVHLEHGARNIQWDRTTEWVKQELINPIVQIAAGDHWIEEKTGLHEYQFIETRRHWFSDTTPHHTHGGFQMLNLVEGEEAVIESPTGAFEPFVVHYAETFIIPASVGEYTIRPSDSSRKGRHGTIKAFVR